MMLVHHLGPQVVLVNPALSSVIKCIIKNVCKKSLNFLNMNNKDPLLPVKKSHSQSQCQENRKAQKREQKRDGKVLLCLHSECEKFIFQPYLSQSECSAAAAEEEEGSSPRGLSCYQAKKQT